MEFKQKEALRYLRAKPGDKAAEILVDTVYLKLRNEVQTQPFVAWRLSALLKARRLRPWQRR